MPLDADVRFSPNSGAKADIAGGLGWATSGLMQRNKMRTQPITSSVRASTIGSRTLQFDSNCAALHSVTLVRRRQVRGYVLRLVESWPPGSAHQRLQRSDLRRQH